MKKSVPSSTNGRNASCCALLKRCTSSRNSTVRRPLARRVAAPRSTAARTSLTPASTADSATNSASHVLRDEPRERRLAGAGRTPEDHRMQRAAFEQAAQRLARREQVRLADELVERARSHAISQRAPVGGRREQVYASRCSHDFDPLRPARRARRTPARCRRRRRSSSRACHVRPPCGRRCSAYCSTSIVKPSSKQRRWRSTDTCGADASPANHVSEHEVAERSAATCRRCRAELRHAAGRQAARR